jgi:hypothetical protein
MYMILLKLERKVLKSLNDVFNPQSQIFIQLKFYSFNFFGGSHITGAGFRNGGIQISSNIEYLKRACFLTKA